MRKLVISTSIAVALGITGCGSDETIEELQEQTPSASPFSRVVFDPGAGNISVPNDLLLLPGDDGFFDFTLNVPVDDPSDFSDPTNALNVLDGWSTSTPFTLAVSTPANTSLDASTLSAGVLIYEATLGLDNRDPECAQITVPSAGCKIGDQLTFGVDYVLSLSGGNTINVVPLRPLSPAQGYMLVITTDLQDSNGNPVQGSATWESVSADINQFPLSSESQLALQGLINSLIDPLLSIGFEREDISYVSAFTTQSTTTALETIKQLYVAEFAARSAAGDPAAGLALPRIVATDAAGPQNAMEALGLVNSDTVSGAVQLGISQLPPEAAALIPAIEATDFSVLQTCDGLLGTASGALESVFGPVNEFAQGVAAGVLGQVGAFCAAKIATATISLPYYSPVPTEENPLAPITEFWEAACDSGVVLAGAPAEVLASATPGPNAALCSQVGLADLRINDLPLDSARHITRFNPVPLPKGRVNGNEQLNVQITIPNPVVSTALGFPISEPESGWPVAMLMHGITGNRQQMLAISGALSVAGIATVAIDQPVHGERGFDVDGDGVDEINASVNVIDYMNLNSLPTGRDNLRQSVSDLLGLRLGLNAFIDASPTQAINLDSQNVSVMGVSLGAIASGSFAAIANMPFEGDLAPLSGLFEVKTASLESPGGGIANFLIESPAFGPQIRALLLLGGSEDFRNFLLSTQGTISVENSVLVASANAFLQALNAEQSAAIQSVFAQFVFAAQTVIDAGDPINYGAILGANTPTLMQTVVGDGGPVNLPDQVISVSTDLPLSGQLPYAGVVGLQAITSTTVDTTGEGVSGLVQFNSGAHASSLSPVASPSVTLEMQQQVAGFMASQGAVIPVTNESVIAN
jgi:Pla-1/cef family extracellular lipase